MTAVENAINAFKKAGLEPYFEEAFGYAIYPNVGKGGLWFVGGAGKLWIIICIGILV